MTSAIDRIEEALAKLDREKRELADYIREAHDLDQTLKLHIKEAKEARDNLSKAIDEMVAPQLDKKLAELVGDLAPQLQEQLNHAIDHVLKEFKKVENMVLHGNAHGKGPGLVDLFGDEHGK